MEITNCMIDWLEFSLFDPDINALGEYYFNRYKESRVENVISMLGLKGLSFENRNGFYYKIQYVYDNCITISSGLKGNAQDDHVHVKITGKGCRFMESMLGTTDLRGEIHKRLQFKLADGSNLYRYKVSRMDICRDYNEKFVVNTFMKDVVNHNFKGARSGSINGEIGKGITLYIGSRKSDKFFRLYEKDLESGKDCYKDRVELVLKDQYATHEFNNPYQYGLNSILSTYMSEITYVKPEVQEVWELMKTELCNISSKIKHRKTNLAEKTDYILRTYGGTLKAYADEYGTKKITEMIHEAVYSNNDLRAIHNAKVINIMRAKRRSIGKRKDADIQADLQATWMQQAMF